MRLHSRQLPFLWSGHQYHIMNNRFQGSPTAIQGDRALKKRTPLTQHLSTDRQRRIWHEGMWLPVESL